MTALSEAPSRAAKSPRQTQARPCWHVDAGYAKGEKTGLFPRSGPRAASARGLAIASWIIATTSAAREMPRSARTAARS